MKTGMDIWTLGKAIADDPFTHMRVYFGPRYPASNPDGYADFITRRTANLPPKAVALAQLAAGGLFSSYRWAHTLTMPTLIVHGSADILLTEANARGRRSVR